MTTVTTEPLPATTVLFDPYFAGIETGELLVQWCPACATCQWPPRSLCRICGDPSVVWRPLADSCGHVFTWTVVHQTPLPALSDETPYVTALIEFPQAGIRMYGLIVGTEPDDMEFGLRVQPDFTHGGPSPGIVWRRRVA